MRVAIKKIFEAEKENGKHMMEVKSDLFNAKKEGVLFFTNDISSISEKEDINIYYSEYAGQDDDRNAFPILADKFLVPRDENERFTLFKKHYETYYPDSEMDRDLFLAFDQKPYKAKQCLWFYRQEA